MRAAVSRPKRQSELVWVDRLGNVEPLGFSARGYVFPRLSPDGKRMMFFNTGTNRRIWMYDFERHTVTPLTPPEERGAFAIWMDDQSIVFSSPIRGAGLNLSTRRVSDTGPSDRLAAGSRMRPGSWSPAHKTLAVQSDSGSGLSISAVVMTPPDYQQRVLVQAAGDPAFSPDGRWIAYSSTDSGRQDVYVQPYPGPGERVPVSPAGGRAPVWRRDGAELFYTTPDGYTRPDRQGNTMTMMAVSVSATADRLLIGPPREMFTGRFLPAGFLQNYDVTADGQRFLMVRALDPTPELPTELVLIQNWFEELKARVPTK